MKVRVMAAVPAPARSLITHPPSYSSVYESPQKPTHQTRTRHLRIGVPLATSDPKFTRGAARRRFTYTGQSQRTGAISRCKVPDGWIKAVNVRLSVT